jgi:hypothetical protein
MLLKVSLFGFMIMNHDEFSNEIITALREPPDGIPTIEMDEVRKNNAARCMVQFICNRLSSNGSAPQHIKHSTFQWRDGIFALRNARVVDHHWTSLLPNVIQQIHEEAQDRPVVYVLTYWDISDSYLHVWAIPEDVAHRSFSELLIGKKGCKTIELFPDTHLLKNAPNAPDLSHYYIKLNLVSDEVEKLVEAIKIDRAAKRTSQEDLEGDESEDVDQEQVFFTTATVDFIKELPNHVQDAEWHAQNKLKYQQVLRDPARSLVEVLRDRYINRLNPEVGGGKRHLSILKKNDYGQGGYHSHFWFAFYDPKSGSKTKSVQLYFSMVGSKRVWSYGFSMGDYCEEYFQRIRLVVQNESKRVFEYLRNAPTDTIVRLWYGDEIRTFSPEESIEHLQLLPDSLTKIEILREYSLESLPDHDEDLVDEVGEFFSWAWPFFVASIKGEWPVAFPIIIPNQEKDEDEDVDEDAPETLEELSGFTSLPLSFLDDLEQSLLAKQQTVLVGPPGTSKTYIARQFARYFVRQRVGRPQGNYQILYMHANWTYEDFFEGIKPTTKDGVLTFEPQDGFFLDFIDQLKQYDPSARHLISIG